ncbi:MAG: hypothetical protein WC600_06205 [Desulfobaccales bacterium]
MKKSTILLAILVLALMTAPAMANCLPGCEVVNGNFETSSPFTWVKSQSSGGDDFDRNGSGNHYADASVSDSQYAALGQVFYEPDWIATNTSKEWTASVKMDTKAGTWGGSGSLVTSFYYYAGSDSDDPAPAFNAYNPVGWTLITSFTAGPPTDGYINFSNYTYNDSGKLDTQPYWLAVGIVLQGTCSAWGSFSGAVDDVCFVGQCVDPVPVPPSVLLLGSGLLGLGALRFRKGTC